MTAHPGAPGPGTDVLETVVFEGRPPQRVDLRRAAPFGWGTAVLLGAVAMVDRIDSALVGGALPKIQAYFHFNDFVGGLLLSAPVFASLLLVVPAGHFADTRRRTKVVAVVTASWGLLTFGAALAPTLALFFLARVLLGVATPLNIPSSSSVVGDLYPSTSRVRAFGILRAMEYLGLPIGVGVGGGIAAAFGWRWAFVFCGIPALIMAAIVALRLREPRRGVGDELSAVIDARGSAAANEEVRELPEIDLPDDIAALTLEERGPEPSVRERMARVLRIRTARYIILGQALLFCGFAGLFSYAATFLYRTHAALGEGGAAGIAGGIGMVGLLAGAGYAIGRRGRADEVRTSRRITVSGWCFVVSVVSIAVIAGTNILALQLVAFLAVNVGNIVALSNLGAATADVIPARERGSGFAVAQFLLTIGSACGAVVVGTGSFLAGDDLRYGIAALLVPLALGALCVFRARATYPADAERVRAEADMDVEQA